MNGFSLHIEPPSCMPQSHELAVLSTVCRCPIKRTPDLHGIKNDNAYMPRSHGLAILSTVCRCPIKRTTDLHGLKNDCIYSSISRISYFLLFQLNAIQLLLLIDYLVQEDKLHADVLDCIRYFYQLNTHNADVSQKLRNDLKK